MFLVGLRKLGELFEQMVGRVYVSREQQEGGDIPTEGRGRGDGEDIQESVWGEMPAREGVGGGDKEDGRCAHSCEG